MTLCDTNIIIEFYKNNGKVVNELRHIGINQLAISVITQAELYYGAINKVELRKIRKHLEILTIFPVDIVVSTKFIELMETYSLTGQCEVLGKSTSLLGFQPPTSFTPLPDSQSLKGFQCKAFRHFVKMSDRELRTLQFSKS
jgi:predicted nucleic acid-binding protein